MSRFALVRTSLAPIGAALCAVPRFLSNVAAAGHSVHQINALNTLSNDTLAERGIEREGIVSHVLSERG